MASIDPDRGHVCIQFVGLGEGFVFGHGATFPGGRLTDCDGAPTTLATAARAFEHAPHCVGRAAQRRIGSMALAFGGGRWFT